MIVNVNKKHKAAEQCISISSYKFESVHRFVYLGSLVNDTNDIRGISRRLQNANKRYYGLQKHFKSRLLTRETKSRIYKTLARPMLLYGCETWTLIQSDILRLSTFERKTLRKIYGPVQEKGEWRMRYNTEWYQLYTLPDITGASKAARSRWAGHAELPRGIMGCKPEGRSVGQLKLRWMNGVAGDSRRLGTKSWWRVARA
jgi:hypothetical protein